MIVAVAILLGLIVANATVYAPRRGRLDSVADSLEKAEQELLYVAGHSEALARVVDYLPADETDAAGDQRFLSGVSSELDRRGMRLTRVEPQEETPYGPYTKRTYKMQIEGTYDGISSFLEYLERLTDLVLVESFDYRSGALSSASRHKGSLVVSVIGH
jgi:Tfp pilus assembly protein PilO